MVVCQPGTIEVKKSKLESSIKSDIPTIKIITNSFFINYISKITPIAVEIKFPQGLGEFYCNGKRESRLFSAQAIRS